MRANYLFELKILMILLLTMAGCATNNLPPTGDAVVSLSWNAPTTTVDGNAITDLAGYKIYYGVAPGQYEQSIQISSNSETSYSIKDLGPETYYFTVTAYDSLGIESDYSEEVSVVVTKKG